MLQLHVENHRQATDCDTDILLGAANTPLHFGTTAAVVDRV